MVAVAIDHLAPPSAAVELLLKVSGMAATTFAEIWMDVSRLLGGALPWQRGDQ